MCIRDSTNTDTYVVPQQTAESPVVRTSYSRLNQRSVGDAKQKYQGIRANKKKVYQISPLHKTPRKPLGTPTSTKTRKGGRAFHSLQHHAGAVRPPPGWNAHSMGYKFLLSALFNLISVPWAELAALPTRITDALGCYSKVLSKTTKCSRCSNHQYNHHHHHRWEQWVGKQL